MKEKKKDKEQEEEKGEEGGVYPGVSPVAAVVVVRGGVDSTACCSVVRFAGPIVWPCLSRPA